MHCYGAEKGVTATITPRDKFCIRAPDIEPGDKLEFAHRAVDIVFNYLGEKTIQPILFSLLIRS